ARTPPRRAEWPRARARFWISCSCEQFDIVTSPSELRERQQAPRPAATVILLRPARDAVEVLVTRRHENMKFMGGLWVFPGGTLSPADSSAAALACLPGAWRAHCPRFTDLHGERLEPDRCAALAVTAYRETFEETGVL